MSLAALISAWASVEPDLDVLTFVSIGEKGNFVDEIRNYQQLWENGKKLAAWLRHKGINKGDSFAIVMSNHPEFVELMVASSIIGAVFVPIDPRIKGHKLRYMLDFSECRGVVAADYAQANVEAECGDREDLWFATLGTACKNHDRIEDAMETTCPSPLLDMPGNDGLDEPMQLLFTSGTTGDPKAILITHRRFTNAYSFAEVLGLTRDDQLYTGLSLTHANAQFITLANCLAHGIRSVISRKFTKSRLWDITRRYGCTFLNLLGGMTTAIYAEPINSRDADNPIRLILSAGMPVAIWEDFQTRFGVKIFEFYGAAEGGLTFNPPGGPVGSCGKAPATLELKILDKMGKECPPYEPGEICFRNADSTVPNVTYFKNSEESIKKTHSGWLHMGDEGHVDENGNLFFHHRMGGGIRRNGDFINSSFVEKVLSEIDVIDDVFIYGVPIIDGAPGEKDLVAAIVLNGSLPSSPQEIFSICEDKLERDHVPGYLHLVDEIPKTASEKPLERILIGAFDRTATYVISQQETSNCTKWLPSLGNASRNSVGNRAKKQR